MNTFIEAYRQKAVSQVFTMKGFAKCWPVWRSEIARITSNFSDPDAIYRLGENLRQIFFLTKDAEEGRSQGAVSGAGAGWEGLVCWYLNAVLTNTPAVVCKHRKSLIPLSIADATTIKYGTFPTNTESDLIGISFPESAFISEASFSKAILDAYCASNSKWVSVHIIQCKTNWNDNAQIPMLWDIIYRSRGFKDNGIALGTNGRSPSDLAELTYSFVTLPTQTKEIKPDSMAVKRVRGLSGGNYWGRPSQPGVAESLSEIFKRVFDDKVIGDVRQHLDNNIRNGHIFLP